MLIFGRSPIRIQADSTECPWLSKFLQGKFRIVLHNSSLSFLSTRKFVITLSFSFDGIRWLYTIVRTVRIY
jgi:hypothetical protein